MVLGQRVLRDFVAQVKQHFNPAPKGDDKRIHITHPRTVS